MSDRSDPMLRPSASTRRPAEPGRLQRYRAKRSAEKTPEPFGSAQGKREQPAGARPGLGRAFVIQKHAARRLHYDFRLELGGTLRSWAVPHGPSLDPAQKRLAVEVEDHPVEYADFEGVIPADNYGAGEVIVWDRGRWVALEDPEEGLRKGKLLFQLHGYKLHGEWTLVRTKRGRNSPSQGKQTEWLLIKHADGWASADGDARVPQESILSGRTLEELQAGRSRADEVRSELARLGAPRKRLRAEDVELMLAETVDKAFSRPGWLFELKYDGFRVLSSREGGAPKILYRRGSDATAAFPDVAVALKTLPVDVVLDGELVVLDPAARPSFQLLQSRVQLRRAPDIERAAVELPATIYVFDLLGFEEFDLRTLPLRERKRLLSMLLPRAGPLRYSDHVEEQGQAMFEEVRRLRLEGVMAKRADAPYRGGRGPDWLKIRADRTGDFVVVGFTEPQGSRAGLGALHVAWWENGGLVYAGRVGTGFTDRELTDLRAALDKDRRPGSNDPPCAGPLPAGAGHAWVTPRRVVEVRYKEWTQEGLLRQPAFLRFRDDKRMEECVREGAPHAAPETMAAESAPVPTAKPRREAAGAAEKNVAFSNQDKIFWPEEGYTKGDLIEYYRAISPWLLPYLRDRPVVLTRYPDGIAGKNFFQKDAPVFIPGWIRTHRVWSEQAQREIDYFICDDLESLLYVANMASIPLHMWSSRVKTLAQPDWCILDLDPKGAPFTDVVKVARSIKILCDRIGLPSFPKTSGSTGLHVLLPLGQQLTYEQSRTLATLLSNVIVQELPEIATVARSIGARGGRVYVDAFQNGHGRTIAGPFSARPVPGALVSMPLRWSEVNARLDPKKFTIKSGPARMKRLRKDPLLRVLELKPDLVRALSALEKRFSPAPAKKAPSKAR